MNNMDLNSFDYENYDSEDEYTPQKNSTSYIPSFTELLSDDQNLEDSPFDNPNLTNPNIDIFGNPISLTQFSTPSFVEKTPNVSTSKAKKAKITTQNINRKNNNRKNTKEAPNLSTNDNSNWTEKEDEALMSAWCLSSTNAIAGKGQKDVTRWNTVVELYEQARVENQNESQIGIRNLNGMKCRYKRLNFLVNKWVDSYTDVLNRPPQSGTNKEDDIELAQKLFRRWNGGNDFTHFNLYNNVMGKHPKWSLQRNNFGVTKEPVGDFGVNGEGSGSSSKRTRSDMDTTSSRDNVSTPSSVNGDEDTYTRPIGREAAKKQRNGKGIVSGSMFSEEDKELISGHKISNQMQIEQRQRRIEADLKIEQSRIEAGIKIEQIKSDRAIKELEMKLLHALLLKQELSSVDEEAKENLLTKYKMITPPSKRG